MSHITGCLGSKVIVAINKDKEANIFNVAHFGTVGDYSRGFASQQQEVNFSIVTFSRKPFE
jgi:hypothetical protein